MGFQAALVPAGAWCEDAWVTTAMLVRSTRRLKYLAAFHRHPPVGLVRRPADGPVPFALA